jgi:hypothetical protein
MGGKTFVALCHKAFAFDWSSFQRDKLFTLLARALEDDRKEELQVYIAEARTLLKDPYQGEPLEGDWMEVLENRDVHEFGDYALTRFYNPSEDIGISDQWMSIDARLPENAKAAMLGAPFGRQGNYFDPGRLGSYFQPPDGVQRSMSLLEECDLFREGTQGDALARYKLGLKDCVTKGLGLYVTF